MNKTQELIEIMKANPDRELIFMYPEEGSDHAYTMGHAGSILIDEYWVDDDRMWLKHEDYDELFDDYADDFFHEMHPSSKIVSDEEEKVINQKTKEFIEIQEWKKCICVYIHY